MRQNLTSSFGFQQKMSQQIEDGLARSQKDEVRIAEELVVELKIVECLDASPHIQHIEHVFFWKYLGGG